MPRSVSTPVRNGPPHASWRRWHRSLAAALLSATMLAGCVPAPSPQLMRPPVDAASLKAQASFAAPATGWPSDGWWKTFHDPQLDALEAEGLRDATDIRAAEARFARAGAMVANARAALLPTLDGTAQASEARQSDNYLTPKTILPQGWTDYGQGTLNLDLSLDFWGKNHAALRAAGYDRYAAGAEAAEARLAVSTGIAAAYAQLASLYQEKDADADAVQIRIKTVELMTERMRQGLENDAAVARAQSAAAGAETDLERIDENIAIQRNVIAALLGKGPDRGLTIARPALPPVAAFGLPASLPANLVGRRPDIMAARYRVEAAAARIKQAKAGFYPNVDLQGFVGVQSLGLDNLAKAGSVFGSVGPAISLPIFEAGRLEAQYHSAEASYAEAVATYDGTLIEALRDVADAVASRHALAGELSSSIEAQDDAAKAWTIIDNRYRGGLATYLEVLNAEDSLISARRTVALLKARAFSLDISLIRSLGGGFRSSSEF